MSEKVRLKISPAVGVFVAPQVSVDEKRRGIAAAAGMSATDRVMLLFCLMRDQDATVREQAQRTFTAVPADVLCDFLSSAVAHPAVLDYIARLHHAVPAVVDALRASEHLSGQARAFLERVAPSAPPPALEVIEEPEECVVTGDPVPETEESEESPDLGESSGDEEMSGDEETIGDEGDEFLSKFKIAQLMGIGEKIKMALTGDKEWRSILIKDANKLVSGSVIKNPRITDAEVLTILKAGVQNDEIVRLICANKEWVKNYAIRKALVENPKTPLPNALRYLATLGEKDIAGYAKSKNISSVLSTQAKRILLSKKR